ncbi:hypothetical protein DFH06DRAFT_1327415 [Mycena polygramma]|nr:hypothetical protein DFH06DRAFT_1327415 [Mycena polygramma]
MSSISIIFQKFSHLVKLNFACVLSLAPHPPQLSGLPVTLGADFTDSVPSVVEFGIISRSDDLSDRDALSAIMTNLTPSESSGTTTLIAPQLRVLRLGCELSDCIDYEAALRMLRRRCGHSCSSLQSAVLLTPSRLGFRRFSPTRLRLFKLREKGLELLLLNAGEASDYLLKWVLGPQWT